MVSSNRDETSPKGMWVSVTTNELVMGKPRQDLYAVGASNPADAERLVAQHLKGRSYCHLATIAVVQPNKAEQLELRPNEVRMV